MSDFYLHPRFYSHFYLWLVGHLLKNKYYFIVSYILLFLTTGITVTIPLILKYFFDTAITSNAQIILLTALQFLFLSFIAFILSMVYSAYNSILSEYTVRNVQQEFFIAIHQKNMSFHDASRSGNLLSMGTSDSSQLGQMFASIQLFSVAIFTIVGVLLSMYYLSIPLMLIFLIFLPFIVFSMYYYSKRIAPIALERQQLFGVWQATLQENLTGVWALRTLSNKDREWNKYLKDLVAVKDVLIRRAKKRNYTFRRSTTANCHCKSIDD